jgi:hypothetical protein
LRGLGNVEKEIHRNIFYNHKGALDLNKGKAFFPVQVLTRSRELFDFALRIPSMRLLFEVSFPPFVVPIPRPPASRPSRIWGRLRSD